MTSEPFASMRPASAAHIRLAAAVLPCLGVGVEADSVRRFVEEELPGPTPDGPASPPLTDEDRERLPDALRGRQQVLVSLAKEDWNTVIQTLGYANNPPADIPGIRLGIKEQVEGGLVGGAP